MICCTFQGRLGNQMFQYAFVRNLYEKRGRKDRLMFNFEFVKQKGPGHAGWDDSLRYFQVLPYETSSSHLVKHYASIPQLLAYAFVMGRIRIRRALGLHVEDEKEFSRLRRWGFFYQDMYSNELFEIDSRTENVFVFGHFENPLFIDPVRNVLLSEFCPKEPLLKRNASLFSVIKNNNSVCVTLRHGQDYLGTQLDVCGEDYISHAIAYMRERLDCPVFIVFSDDIEWARSIFSGQEGFLFESGDDPIWEKIRLMSACRHFIITNSTFSWWAQYLGNCSDKIVVSPSSWINKDIRTYLIEDSFVKLNAN